jgi:hypothetical protein
MQFINPIEILELSTYEISEVDNSLIKKAKRKLFADIDLSDNGHLNYKGLSLTKTDCEKVIDELESPYALEFYSRLSKNNLLNDFLVNGSEKLFTSFKQESIYKLPEFIKFISPFFAQKFDKAILKAFVDEDSEKLRSILRTHSLISSADQNVAFMSLSIEIQNRIQQIDSITKDIKNEVSEYSDDNLKDVISLVLDLFPTETLNQLPAYFQSQINKIAASINFLQLAIWNEFNTTSVPLHLLEHLLELNIESVNKPTFQKNYFIIRKKHEERIEQDQNAPILKKWATILLAIQSQIKNVENKSIQATDALETIKGLVIISELNSLPNFANEIRTQIGYSIRNLSIASWNKQNDIYSALFFIGLAIEVKLNDEIKLNFINEKSELKKIENKYNVVFNCFFCQVNKPDENAVFSQELFLETNRITSGRTTSVNYQCSEIKISRCNKCKRKHFFGDIIYFSTLVVTFLFICTELNSIGFKVGEGWFLILIFSWILSKVIIVIYFNKVKIENKRFFNLKKHQLIAPKLNSGWTFYQPRASGLSFLITLIALTYDLFNSLLIKIIQSVIKAITKKQ